MFEGRSQRTGTESDKVHVVQAIQAGITDYLVKPFTPDALQEKIGKYTPPASDKLFAQ